MEHLQPFNPRSVLSFPMVRDHGWSLKRYAILSEGREFDNDVASAALTEAFNRLPDAGSLADEAGNQGVGFQIIHFAQTAVVSPVFYWQWGSVLANVAQMRAKWEAPTVFGDGVDEVVGCVWEMEVVCFEVSVWKGTVLNDVGSSKERLSAYLGQRLA